MAITTLPGREFGRNIGKAKKAAEHGPVFVTDRGQPTHVLLTIDEYRRLTNHGKNIVDLLAMPGAAEIDFDPPRLTSKFYRRTS